MRISRTSLDLAVLALIVTGCTMAGATPQQSITLTAPAAIIADPTAEIATPTATPPPTPTPAPTLEETPGRTLVDGYYVVQPGDTLLAIAYDFSVTIDALIVANPGLDPDLILPDQEIVIPLVATNVPQSTPTVVSGQVSTDVPQTAPTEIGGQVSIDVPQTAPTVVSGQVSTDGSRLRVREGPSTNFGTVATLEDGTPLTVIGRTDDFYWVQVVVTGEAGIQGWVMRQWVMSRPLDGVPMTYDTATHLSTTVQPQGTAQPGLPQAVTYPYISNITATAHAIFVRGQQLGNRADVFSKVGDSITDNDAFLTPIGLGNYNLRDFTFLKPVIEYFSQEPARDANSFANTSLAAKGGWSAWQVVTPRYANSDLCLDGEIPLVCEYRIVRPSVALIMLGTNDVQTTPTGQYESWMRQIIQTSFDMGVIPVLSTIPEFNYAPAKGTVDGRVAELNGVIVRLAHEYDIPLWDYHAALDGLPNDGLSDDGVHPGWAAPADFKPYFLQFGMTVRNLTALEALDAVWRTAMH